MNEATQESKTVPVGAKVTPMEKRAIDLVATVESLPVAELLRREGIDALVGRGKKYAEQLRNIQPVEPREAVA